MKIPAELKPEMVWVCQDTREQNPLCLDPLPVVVKGMPTGDYGLLDFPDLAACERKELGDLCNCCGKERDRFEREVLRLLAYPVRCLVVEASYEQIEAGDYRSEIKPQTVVSSLLGWQAQGLPVILAGDHTRAGRFVSKFLFIAARRRYRECRALLGRFEPAEQSAQPKE